MADDTAALDNLLAAKEAYFADRNDTTLAAKNTAAEELRALRRTAREGRPTTVGGDAFVMPDNERT